MKDIRYFSRRFTVLVIIMVMSGCGKKKNSSPIGANEEKIAATFLIRQPDGRFTLKSTGQVFTGVQRENWPDSTPKIEFNFKDGRQSGRCRAWHENGRLGMEGT